MDENINSELNKCPFCGGDPVYVEVEDILWCDTCQAQAPNGIWDDRPGEDAARKEQYEADCKVMCLECKHGKQVLENDGTWTHSVIHKQRGEETIKLDVECDAYAIRQAWEEK